MASGAEKIHEFGDIGSVCIVGLGLLGGSLAKALKKHCPDVRVNAWARRKESVEEALRQGIIDHGSDDAESIVSEGEFIVLCVPLQATLDFVTQHKHSFNKEAIVTDVGSVKSPIVSELTDELAGQHVHFIGSHPMAGSEQSGLENADEDLFNGASVFITPESPEEQMTDASRCEDDVGAKVVSEFWQSFGSRAHVICSEKHDQVVARTSHLPHLLSSSAVNEALFEDSKEVHEAAGGGFRDFSRIAESSPSMWKEIFYFNRENLIGALNEYIEQLNNLKNILAESRTEEIEQYLQEARSKRREWIYGVGEE